MKILIIDNDIFYLHLMEKQLQQLNFEVLTADSIDNALSYIKEPNLNLIITDIHLDDENGLDLIKMVRQGLHLDVPILVLSSDDNFSTVELALELGANDYLGKPVTLKNLGYKIYKMLGLEFNDTLLKLDHKLINAKRIGVVIPCYNEAERLESEEFQKHVLENSSYHLCFVNDGSKDNTLEVLQKIQQKDLNKISIYNLEKNSGKAEAVRRGILYLMNEKPLDYIGFLDADLSTDFQDFDALVKLIQTDQYDAVIGSRITRAGAEIYKESKRSIISYVINKIIVSIIKIDIKDTQCGAKIFSLETAKEVYRNPFISRWLFDVEIFIRMKNWKRQLSNRALILEYPLQRWIHKDGSKLGFKDSLKIFSELNRINKYYKKLSY